MVDEHALRENLTVLDRVQRESGARVLLALKAFSMFSLAPVVMEYLSGTCASGIHEARLGREEFGGEVHTFNAAFTEAELREVLEISDHVVFNSFSQWTRFKDIALAARLRRPQLKFGLRVNPEHSEGAVPLYDPCAPCSRLGIPRSEFDGQSLEGITGLHMHTLCEQDFMPLKRTIEAFERSFGEFIPQLEWINFGGGHHITRDDYQIDDLITSLQSLSQRWGVQLYLEPGEAIAYHCGVLVAEVLDLTHNGMDLAILDTSATCHMPDTLEMPYRAEILDAGAPGEQPHCYRLGGQTCLAGDVIGDYAFASPLRIGQRVIFEDMAYYTMVKTNTFNGINLPSMAIWNSATDELQVVKTFGYDDFRNRLS